MPDSDASPTEGGSGPDRPEETENEGPGLRNTLANERTLLAWFRTGLALLAASFAVVKLTDITPHALRLAMGSYLIALAIGVIAAGYVQWRIRQARIRKPAPLDRSLPALSLTVALFLLAGFVLAVIVVAP
ncbi:YidH family protein [Actinomadura nitritigenes]|uniref:YidH family protein n=1 Tax=Actinomadura nitritigenes TaxID=134602 RepID=UPI003D8F977F